MGNTKIRKEKTNKPNPNPLRNPASNMDNFGLVRVQVKNFEGDKIILRGHPKGFARGMAPKDFLDPEGWFKSIENPKFD